MTTSGMMTSGFHSSPPSDPVADLVQFLDEIPSPFREELLMKLYVFFANDAALDAEECVPPTRSSSGLFNPPK